MYAKKRVEIVVEAPVVSQVIEIIEGAGAKGYTVFPRVGGRGPRRMRDEGYALDAGRNSMLLVVASADSARRIIDGLQPLLDRFAGIVFVSDVEVVRDDHF